MRKPSISKQVVVWVTLMLFVLGPVGIPASQASAAVAIDPVAFAPLVRDAALSLELDSLAEVAVPEAPNLGLFLNSDTTGTPNAEGYPVVTQDAMDAAVILGKALFWDMQVGSDGQACGSCHFSAGADSRIRHQLNPGIKAGDGHYGNSTFPQFRPDYTLKAADFPFHRLEDADQLSYTQRVVVADTNDVCASQGVFPSIFAGITLGKAGDIGDLFVDPTFNLLNPFAVATSDNVRRVEPRNTPTMINTIFNFMNFWDGRAHNQFNGVSPIGPLDTNAKIWVTDEAGVLSRVTISIPNSSLASLSTGPPANNNEMSFFDRPFPLIGRKLLSLTPLGQQKVHPDDSVLGPYALDPKGISVSYADLIHQAFQPKYWDSATRTPDGYTLTEANFTLIFGLAVQSYIATLVSDETPYDAFMEGDNAALSAEQLHGFLVFLNSGRRNINSAETATALTQLSSALSVTIGAGNCINCHGSALFTDATVEDVAAEPIEVERTAGLTADGKLQRVSPTAFVDNGFANIGVRPTSEDLGRGESVGQGFPFPLSFGKQMVLGLSFAFPQPLCGPGNDPPTDPCPLLDVNGLGRVSADGNFKIPGLRNVELTGPYFHNGGQMTLEQVVAFYSRQGDFGDVNVAQLERNLAFVDLFETDEDALVGFLKALTDERVRLEQAPFDHPQVLIPNGGTFGYEQPRIDVPAVGGAAPDGGRPAAGLPPLKPFHEQFVYAKIVAKPAAIDFGDVAQGHGKTWTMLITSKGTDTLAIGQITLAPAGSFIMENDNCSNQELAPAASCTIHVEFESVMTGVKYASLSIPSNDPDTPATDVPLVGVVVPAAAPALTVNDMDAWTQQHDRTVCGTMEAGITPVVTCSSGSVNPVKVNGSTWCAQITGLASGTNNITVTAAGPAGNITTKAVSVNVVVPDGCFSGTGQATVSDALKALRIAVGIVPATAVDMLHGDVAPLGAPNNRIDTADALMILKKSVGVMSF